MTAPDWTAINAGPTPTLDEYRALEKADPNAFWRLDCGHHQNLLDAALDATQAEVERLRTMLGMERSAMEANEALGAALVEARAEVQRLTAALALQAESVENAAAEVERLRDRSRVRVEHQRGSTFGVYIDGVYAGAIDGEAT